MRQPELTHEKRQFGLHHTKPLIAQSIHEKKPAFLPKGKNGY